MKPSRFLACTAVLALASATTMVAKPTRRASFNAPADVAAIKQVEEVLASETDIDKVMPLYADDAVVLDMFMPGLYQGKAEIRAGFAPQLAAIKSMTKTTPEMTIASDGRFACAASQIAYHTVMKDGSSFAMNVRELDALKKINGKWRVVQQHLSLPVDPATLTAQPAAPIQPRSLAWSAQPLAPVSTTPAAGATEIRRWMEEGGASVGLEKMMNYYGPGDDVLLYDAFSPKAVIGKREIASFYAPIMSSYMGVSMQLPSFTADSDGSFGFQIDTQRMTLNLKDGTKRNIALRQSDCMRRVGGKWYSFIEMVSYPLDAKTMKAQMTF